MSTGPMKTSWGSGVLGLPKPGVLLGRLANDRASRYQTRNMRRFLVRVGNRHDNAGKTNDGQDTRLKITRIACWMLVSSNSGWLWLKARSLPCSSRIVICVGKSRCNVIALLESQQQYPATELTAVTLECSFFASCPKSGYCFNQAQPDGL